MMRKIILFLFFLAGYFAADAQTYALTGRITDPQHKPIGFVSIYILNSTYGTTANEDGRYTFNLTPGSYQVVYRFVGYRQQTDRIIITDHDERHDIQMVADSFILKRAMVRTGRDTDANNIMRQVIRKRTYYRDEVKAYTCAVYVKGVQRLISAPKQLLGRNVLAALELDSNRKGILYQTEILSKLSVKQPHKIKEVTIASKSAGQNTAFSYNKASDIGVDFYKNWFKIEGLSARGFISPIASFAMAFYRYKLLGTSVTNGKVIDKVAVIPRRRHDPVFRGVIYIMEGDWRIYGTDLLLTKDASINLVDTLEISQQYIPVKDNIWMPGSVQFNFKGNVLGFKFDGYYAGIYNNYNLSPGFPDHFFNGEIMRVDTLANSRDSSFWARNRPLPLTPAEARDYHKKDSIAVHRQSLAYLDSAEHADNQVSPFNFTVTGYQYTNRRKGETFYVYPFYRTIYYNTVEGYGIYPKVKFTKTFASGRSYAITPALRYGFANRLFSANVSLAYNYDPDQQGQFYGAFGSDLFDLSNVGTRSLTFNTLSTLLNENNYVKYYRSKYGRLGYQHELANGLLWNAELEYATRDQLYNISFNHIKDYPDKTYTSNNPLTPTAETPLFPHHNALTFKTSLLISFNQQYITRPTGRVYEPAHFPQVRINYRKGISNVLGSGIDYDFTSVDVFDDHVSFGLLGFGAFKITAGDFFNRRKLYYMDYNHFLGNQGTVFDPAIGGFHYLPFYTYSANSGFVEAHYEHDFGGNLFNLVPLLRKLKLEEIAGGNYLTEKNNNNYYEFYFGIKRLIFRLDYGFAYNGNHKIMQGIKLFYGLK